jgi:hypothetical protein
MPATTTSFRISMVSNVEHSLQRGYEVLAEGLREDNPYLVKEALMWVHHGVELALKQLLVDEASEYLIFENIDRAVRKLENLRHDSGMAGATSIQLFEHTSVRTVGYSQLLGRVSVILDIDELALGSPLRDDLTQLGNSRNKIVHSPAEVDIRPTAILLSRIGEPFLNLIVREMGDNGPTYDAKMTIGRAMTSARYLAKDYVPQPTEREDRILSLAKRFQGQEVPGSLFGQDGLFTLPWFSQADIRRETGYGNFIVEGEDERWLVWVARGYANKETMLVKKRLADRERVDQLWVAGATTHPFVYPETVVSSKKDLERLEEILGSSRGQT